MVKLAFGFTLMILTGVACSSTPETYDQYGGGAEYTFECKHTTAPCYFNAQERCRNGYNVLHTVQTERTGGVYGRYRVFIMSIKCNK